MGRPRMRLSVFFLTNKRHIFRDVSVINRFNTGSDYRMGRGFLNINIRLEMNASVKVDCLPNSIPNQSWILKVPTKPLATLTTPIITWENHPQCKIYYDKLC